MRKTRNHIEKDWLYDQYIIQQKTTNQIAKELNVGYGSVNYFLHKYSIKKGTLEKKLDKDILYDLYINQNLPKTKIMIALNCCRQTLDKNIDNYNLDDFKKWDLLNEQIGNLYLKERLSIGQIAKILNWPKSRVRNQLIKMDIKRRNKSECQSIYSKGAFKITWMEPNTRLIKRCRVYFSNHIASKIDKQECCICKKTNNLHIHHIQSFSYIINSIINENPSEKDADILYQIIIKDSRFLNPQNLQVVCINCHYTIYHPYSGYTVNQQPSLI